MAPVVLPAFHTGEVGVLTSNQPNMKDVKAKPGCVTTSLLPIKSMMGGVHGPLEGGAVGKVPTIEPVTVMNVLVARL